MRRVLDHHITATHRLAGRQFHLRLIGRQAVELIDHLLDLAQVDPRAFLTWKGHRQLTRRQAAVGSATQFLELAFNHQHLQVAFGQILLRQISARGHQTFFDVVIGDDFEQLVELGNAQALTDIRLDQVVALSG